MRTSVKYFCVTCYRAWVEAGKPFHRGLYLEHEWQHESNNFSKAFRHQQENPDHEISAEIDVEVSL